MVSLFSAFTLSYLIHRCPVVSQQIRPNKFAASPFFLTCYHSSMIIFLPLAFSWLFKSIKRNFFFYLNALQSCAFGGNLLQVNLPYLLGKYIAKCPISCLPLIYNCIQSYSCSQLNLLLLIHSITMFLYYFPFLKGNCWTS